MTVWVLAADRVTAKVAATVPVFPSVTLTSLIRSDGGWGGGGPAQMPSLSRTETVFELPFTSATSERLSPLKSPTAMGPEPAGNAPASWPLPGSRVAPTTRSRLPSPLKSPTKEPVPA